MSDVVATLTAARELLSAPERWTKGEAARDANGVECLVAAPNAASWCSIGAILKHGGSIKAECGALEFLGKVTNHGVTDFNDAPTTTHADILAAFDRAIAAAKAEDAP